MRFMLLIHQGATPTPQDPEAWARLSPEEQRAVYTDYRAINETPGVTPSAVQMQPPETATTVRVEDGRTLTTDGPFVETKEALGGYLFYEADDLDAALHSVPARDAKILLCHNPLGVRRASEQGIDLVLSGHTHGGQVRLPVVGSFYGRSKLGERFVEGWNRLNGTQIYVSRGIGKVLVPLRVGCPPEITCLRLRRFS